MVEKTNNFSSPKVQKISLTEYEALKAKEANKPKVALPKTVRYILLTPVVLLFCFGLFFIPYMLLMVATSPSAKTQTSDDDHQSWKKRDTGTAQAADER